MSRQATPDEIAYKGSVLRCEQLYRMRRGELAPGPCDRLLAADPALLDDTIRVASENLRELAARIRHRNAQTGTDAARRN